MLFYLQFVIAPSENVRALAWPFETRGKLSLISTIFHSIGYGDETLAIADLDRWMEAFPMITFAEVVSIPMTGE